MGYPIKIPYNIRNVVQTDEYMRHNALARQTFHVSLNTMARKPPAHSKKVTKAYTKPTDLGAYTTPTDLGAYTKPTDLGATGNITASMLNDDTMFETTRSTLDGNSMASSMASSMGNSMGSSMASSMANAMASSMGNSMGNSMDNSMGSSMGSFTATSTASSVAGGGQVGETDDAALLEVAGAGHEDANGVYYKYKQSSNGPMYHAFVPLYFAVSSHIFCFMR